MLPFANKPTHLTENNCMAVFNTFKLLQTSVFIEDEIQM